MLHFFRKYQKYIFLVVTLVTIITFVFFGTYQAFVPSETGVKDTTHFHTVSGKPVKKLYFEKMCRFLADEGSFQEGGNFLNDGVITKDFFETRLAYPLFINFKDTLGKDLQARLEKERAFTPYTHPQTSLIAAEKVWSLFATDLWENLIKLKSLSLASTEEAFQTRVALYQAERRFSAPLLSQVLRYQEREHQLTPDPKLYKGDLALFGYETLSDWFGPHFVESVACVIMNGADLARHKGYSVTQEEALVDLLKSNHLVFESVKEEIDIPHSDMFFHRFLQHKGLDEKSVVEIWQNVLLFRRLFSDAGFGASVDTLALSKFYNSAHESFETEVTELPEELRFQTLTELQQFETYLEAIAGKRKDPLPLPKSFDDPEVVEKRAPQLVGKTFFLEIATLDKKELEAKVSLKEMWEWETKVANFAKIRSQFPGLELKEAKSAEECDRLLEALETSQRMSVNAYARSQIVDLHPTWIEEGLEAKPREEKELVLGPFGHEFPLRGIEDQLSFLKALESQESLKHFSQDQKTYYDIQVKRKEEKKQILSFSQALELKVLNQLPQVDCKPLVQAIYQDARKSGLIKEEISDGDLEAKIIPYRFAAYMRDNKNEKEPLFKFVNRIEFVSRAKPTTIFFDQIAKLEKSAVSDIQVSTATGAYFFCLKERKSDTSFPLIKWFEASDFLSKEVKSHLFHEILQKVNEKGSVCFIESKS